MNLLATRRVRDSSTTAPSTPLQSPVSVTTMSKRDVGSSSCPTAAPRQNTARSTWRIDPFGSGLLLSRSSARQVPGVQRPLAVSEKCGYAPKQILAAPIPPEPTQSSRTLSSSSCVDTCVRFSILNDRIRRAAADRRVALIDRRLICDDSNIADAIEPFREGGSKILA